MMLILAKMIFSNLRENQPNDVTKLLFNRFSLHFFHYKSQAFFHTMQIFPLKT